jgi:lysophospholipase L1-like esterase
MYPVINYVALGDSITAGVGAYIRSNFTQHYANMLQNHTRASVNRKVNAKRGITSGELQSMLRDPSVQRDLSHVDLVTITIGGNDLLQANRLFGKTKDPAILEKAVKQYEENMRTIVATIERTKAHSQSPYLIQLIGLYNPFPEIPYSDYWIHQLNQNLHSMTSQHIQYVDLESIFYYYGKDALFLSRIHPNAKGHYFIAQQLMDSYVTWQKTLL